MDNPGQCKALNVSDEQRCLEAATSINGLFCSFHSKQCQGLYRGYKTRNARLDRLSANPPKFLADSKVSLSNETFKGIETKDECKEVHDHLFLKLQLLERVIRARRLHHSRFFAENCDYGHAKFLDALQEQKATAIKALERLERRTAEVLYKQQKWFTWVRECQDEEEKSREKEQKKVRMEAAMFKRHWKAAQLRARDVKAKEDKMRQETFLEMVYKERLLEREKNGENGGEDDDGMDWDPIEDVLEDNRGSYLDLIQSFLWMVDTNAVSATDVTMDGADAPGSSTSEPLVLSETSESAQKPNGDVPKVIKPSHSSKKAKAKNKKKAASAPKPQEPLPEPDKGLIETREEIHERLKNGSEFDNDRIKGVMIAGTIENPVISTKTVTYPEDQIQKLLTEIHDIKHLLFCRLLLGHATLLPAALRANSVEEFLADPEVTTAALRDVCLKMESPSLQEIRDACADLFRSEEEEDEADLEMSEPESNADSKKKTKADDMPLFKPSKRKGELPDTWHPKGEMAKQAEAMGVYMPTFDSVMHGGESGGAVKFGDIKDAKNIPRRKIRVKICGRSIWNYPSDKAMNRGGWLHFCIIAKDSSLHDAVALCRHWDEFFELNILAIWHYFPGANWGEWVGNRYRQQMLQLGFIMYFESAEPDAQELTVRQQNGGRGQFRRSHAVFEARNFICAHIKRDDQASRRLIQYLSMQSSKIVVLVRDAESGKLLIKPPEEERWLFREKSGLGRASRNDWHIIKSIGPQFFEEMDKYRQWKFSFKEYYDVYVWDLEAGEPFPVLYNCVQEMLFKALRIRSGPDLYNLAGPVLKTIYKDPETHYFRDIRPGEEIESVWDSIHHEGTQFFYGKIPDHTDGSDLRVRRVYDEANKFPRNLFYHKADELEDEILFPEERAEKISDPLDVGKADPIQIWQEEGLSMRKFIEGWETDSDFSEWDSITSGEQDDSEFDDEDENIEDDDEMDNAVNDVDKQESGSKLGVPDIVRAMGWSNELKEAMEKLSLKNKPAPKDRGSPAVMHAEFMTFLDREKAKIFKQVWHKADLEPHAQAHYIEMMEMTKRSRRHNHKKFDCAPVILGLRLVDELNVGPEDAKDVQKAIAKIAPFFYAPFLESEEGEPFRASLMFNQAERAKNFPDIRSHVSNKYRPPDFFKELDKEANGTEVELENLPFEWDVHVRPIIAHLYKSGVIQSRSDVNYEGQAFAGKETGRDKYDLFIDYRLNIPTIQMPPDLVDPHSITPFKNTAKTFSLKHPTARFAVLTIWSAPHFYPLMIGWDNRRPTSFRDHIGRHFNWMFVPKDMPCSEFSIHHSAKQRIAPFKKFLGKKVIQKRDKLLVMGTDEKELFTLVAATTFAIQKNPWRLEVDLWKSFVNVDFGFLEGLNDKWLE